MPDTLTRSTQSEIDITTEDRFWAKVDKTETCWLWTACTDRGGYGHFRADRKTRLAHRVAYEMCVGPIPDGLQLDHLCRVRRCVNPDHLEPVTNRENTLRGNSGAYLAAKTHCPSGHPYAGANLYVGSHGDRQCRTCRRAAGQRHDAKRRAA